MLACCVATKAQPIEFEAASIKMVKLADHLVFGNRGGPGTSDPTRIHLCCVGMFSLVQRAYDVELDRLFGPAWIMENMGPNLYEVDAVMPPGTSKERYRAMLQRLLEDRFHLAIHKERRTFPGYELVVDDAGPKLRESPIDPSFTPIENAPLPPRDKSGMFLLPPGPQMLTSLGWGVIVVQAQQEPIGELVKVMGRMINQSLGENPNDYSSPKARVVDRTGLTGTYDFTLRFSCELCQFAVVNGAAAPPPPAQADSPNGEPSIFTALKKQLGLKLNKTKDVPLDVIVVDRVDKIPTSN